MYDIDRFNLLWLISFIGFNVYTLQASSIYIRICEHVEWETSQIQDRCEEETIQAVGKLDLWQICGDWIETNESEVRTTLVVSTLMNMTWLGLNITVLDVTYGSLNLQGLIHSNVRLLDEPCMSMEWCMGNLYLTRERTRGDKWYDVNKPIFRPHSYEGQKYKLPLWATRNTRCQGLEGDFDWNHICAFFVNYILLVQLQ